MESYLALRGLRTLSVRLERACSTPRYSLPGWQNNRCGLGSLPRHSDHPQADRVASLLDHHGALVRSPLIGARADKLCAIGTADHSCASLGGVESLIERGRLPR